MHSESKSSTQIKLGAGEMQGQGWTGFERRALTTSHKVLTHCALLTDLLAHYVYRGHKIGKCSDYNGWQNQDC